MRILIWIIVIIQFVFCVISAAVVNPNRSRRDELIRGYGKPMKRFCVQFFTIKRNSHPGAWRREPETRQLEKLCSTYSPGRNPDEIGKSELKGRLRSRSVKQMPKDTSKRKRACASLGKKASSDPRSTPMARQSRKDSPKSKKEKIRKEEETEPKAFTIPRKLFFSRNENEEALKAEPPKPDSSEVASTERDGADPNVGRHELVVVLRRGKPPKPREKNEKNEKNEKIEKHERNETKNKHDVMLQNNVQSQAEVSNPGELSAFEQEIADLDDETLLDLGHENGTVSNEEYLTFTIETTLLETENRTTTTAKPGLESGPDTRKRKPRTPASKVTTALL